MTQEDKAQAAGSRYIVPSIIIGLSLVVCALIGSRTIIKVRGMGQSIRVTGAAVESIRSDYAIWQGDVSVQAPVPEQGYDKLRADIRKVDAFLKEAGFSPDQYSIGSVNIYRNYNRDQEVTGFTLQQTVKLEMSDVDRVARVSRDASTLIEKGVMMESRPPQFLYTGIDTLKVEMIRRATENAKIRAEQLAETTGRKVGPPTSAGVGVFQIRPRHSQEVSGYGISDVTSIEKEIVSTVHVEFQID